MTYCLIVKWWFRSSTLFNIELTLYIWQLLCHEDIKYIICIMFKNITFFIIKLLILLLYVRVDILLTRIKHFHDRITSLRGEVWALKISLIPPPFIEMHVPSTEIERSSTGVLGVSISPLLTILISDLGTVPTVWYLFSSFYQNTAFNV
jgi:hypothetical protein